MLTSRVSVVAMVLVLTACGGCTAPGSHAAKETTAKAADVDGARIVNADREPGNWMSHGRTYKEERFSPLQEINDKNVGGLALAWYYDLDTRRGQEATPIVVDGTMYFSTAWSKVVALNAATGARLWSYDPKVPPEWAANACCDVVNRGVAVWRGKVFVGTLDGRLVALDAATGKVVWEKLTIDRKFRYTITGAPRVVKGKVVIGNGGAEMGVRGYVTAFDAETGNMVWRFYTVPGDPSKPFESPILEQAAKTWTGEWWKSGGGGTVWDAIVYDSELDLLFIGVGNGQPWDEKARSPRGGDNLFICSIVALRPDTGEYVWHYQEVPHDAWDYDSDEQMILTDLKVDGQTRKVLLQAPKDGFFYVLDRATGKLISAKPFTNVNWATGVDPQSGRPVETREARYAASGKAAPVVPGPSGAHSWQPMSYNPLTGLVYFPVQEAGLMYKSEEHFQQKSLAFNTGIDFVTAGLSQDAEIKKKILEGVGGHLAAWDPVRQKEVWRADRRGAWNGGVVSTAGNLVFEGTGEGQLEAFRAATGEKLWSAPTQSGVIAAPVTYTANGEQYVALLVGWGGVFPLAAGEIALKAGRVTNVSRMLAFKLGGKQTLPPLPNIERSELNPPPSKASPAIIEKGRAKYQRYCSNCHGDVAVSGGVLPDLRYSATLSNGQWFNIVMDGWLKPNGMISFSNELSRPDAAAIRDYVIFRANESLRQAGSSGKAASRAPN
jgi:quinohemoprotein ethanol dehydrogenase